MDIFSDVHFYFSGTISKSFTSLILHVLISLNLLRNEADECFLSPFFCLKSRENHTDDMTKNDPLAVTLI